MIVVFAGPTLRPADYPGTDPRVRWAPPARRGDLLDAARDPAVETLVLLDGLFQNTLAVSPEEIRAAAAAPVRLIGASSMGALRAAECWPVPNVHGSGLVYSLYRDGRLDSDDEVAVATDPDRDYRQVSTPLIDMRIGLQHALRARLLPVDDARAILAAAAAAPYYRRSWSGAFHASKRRPSPEAVSFLKAFSQKRADGIRAIDHAVSVTGTEPLGDRRPPSALRRRYAGVPPLLGHDKPATKVHLLHWIFGSGRYEQFAWPMIATRIRRRRSPGTVADLRDDAIDALTVLLRDEQRAADLLWDELEYRGELTRLLFWWSAARSRVDAADPDAIRRALDHIAIRHGYDGEATLMADMVDGRLMDAIPSSWVLDAAAIEAAIMSGRRR